MRKHLLFKSLLLLCALIVGTNAWAATTTYQHVFNAKPSTGNNVTLSSVKWNISATNLGNYNSGNYAGVQLGTSSKNGSITLTSSSAWGSDTGTYKDKTKITEVRLWLNLGGTSVTPTVTIGGKSATSDGTTVVKNSSAGSDWTKTTKVTFTPAADGNTGVVVINVATVKAGYICCMEIDCEEAGSASDPRINADNVDILYTATSGSINYTISNPVVGGTLTAARTAGDWLTVGEVDASSVAFTCLANTGYQRTATVRLTYTYNTSEAVTKDVTITQAIAPQTYTLASSITSGKIYVIASGTSGGVNVLGEQRDTNRGTVGGTVSETTLTTTNPAEVVVYGPDATGYYTLYTADGYLYAASSGNNYLKSQSTNDMNGKWSISFDSETKEAEVVAHGTNTRNILHYNPNSGNPVFSCYGSTSSVDNPVYLFEKADAAVATTTSVKLNGSGYATFATTTALDFQDADDATFSAWEITAISGSTITFNQIKKHVAAGKGILLKGTADATVNLNIMPAGGDALSSNKLVGITEDTAVAADTYYGLSGNQFKKVNAGTVPAGKALLPANEVPASARELTFVFDEATGIKQVETSKSIIEGIYNLAGQKVQNPTKGLYIMNGKKVIIK